MNKLSVEAINARLKGEFERLGFRTIKRRPLKLVMHLNDETELFAYPGAQRSGQEILIDPVLGIDNLQLREKMRRSEEPWKNTHSVCHVYLGMLDSWGQLRVRAESEVDHAVSRVMDSVAKVCIPALRGFDSLASIASLFEAKARNQGPVGIAVLFPEEKLDLLRQIEER